MFWSKYIAELNNKLDNLTKDMQDHDKVNDKRLDDIEKVLIAQEMNLNEHMKRSEHLEEIVEVMRAKNEADMKPLSKHIAMVEGVFKFLGLLGLIIAIIGGIANLLI